MGYWWLEAYCVNRVALDVSEFLRRHVEFANSAASDVASSLQALSMPSKI
jgi:hypothetical protein